MTLGQNINFMNFKKAKGILSRRDRLRLFQILKQWEKNRIHFGSEVVKNLREEESLQQGIYDQLIEHIIGAHDLHKSSLKNAKLHIQHFCRENIYEGKDVTCKKPHEIGSVLAKKTVLTHLVEEYGSKFLSSSNDFEDILRQYEKYDYLDSRFYGCSLKKPERIVWITWSDEDHTAGPFSFVLFENNDREEIRVALGLGFSHYAFDNMYCFTFDHTDIREKIKIPTFCDADLNVFFRPAALDAENGKTQPLDNGMVKDKGHKYHVRGRPEGVLMSRCLTFHQLKRFKEAHFKAKS